MHAETPVTVSCDWPMCPVTELVIAVAIERHDDIPDVRVRARAAAVDIATGRGWRVRPDGVTFCPLHARGLAVLL